MRTSTPPQRLAVSVLLTLLCGASSVARAEDFIHLIHYIEQEGRFIELSIIRAPDDIDGRPTFIAIEANDIATSENYDRLDASFVRAHHWSNDNGSIVLRSMDGRTRRYASHDVRLMIAKRPFPMNFAHEPPTSSERPSLANSA